ncbi:translesion DNA synthesis-associated protein ImuA [Methylococcus sp. EFPC2]|uniref:translesion DNA synthesis-associated protein ImuA n=1 Tax=Methylococcus sp. EFPC2 TaxID=2812648 RepID=UPI00196773B3|nr:translesion DNA synthesis-associated protein ImuA [Methylococcus sp. EFPC2]QSA98321.1 translesion DNA synthesis-associated protein ImuA [Methylococcus sp. EFPC2]
MNGDTLEQLIRSHPGIWRGRRAEGKSRPAVATGFPELDTALPDGGWPLGALMEIRMPCLGIGELRLLLPAMASISRAGRWIAWVTPPHRPYAPALLQAGVQLHRLLVVDAGQAADIPWSLEKMLRSGHCGMALAWPQSLADHQARRLQLAAEEGGALAVLFSLGMEPSDTLVRAKGAARSQHKGLLVGHAFGFAQPTARSHKAATANSSHAALRIEVKPAEAETGLAVDILKARGCLHRTSLLVRA